MKLRLFGRPEIWCGGECIPLSVGKPLALLCYLAACAPRAVPRPELLALLWEDAGPQHLRQALYTLRRTLGEQLTVEGTTQLRYTGQSDLGSLGEVPSEVFLDRLEAVAAPRFQGWLAGQRRAWTSRSLSGESADAPLPSELPGDWLEWAQAVWGSPDPEAISRLLFGDTARALEVAERLDRLRKDQFTPAPEAVQKLLHSRAAQHLQAEGGDPARIAAHFLEAQEHERASPHLLASARSLMAARQPEQARRQALTALWASTERLQRAEALFLLEELADQARESSLHSQWLAELEKLIFQSQSDDLLYRLALVQAQRRRQAGKLDLAAQSARSALDIARRLGQTSRQHEASLMLGTLALLAGQLEGAEAAFRPLLAASDTALQMRARLNLGTVYAMQGRRQMAVGHLERALTLARQLGNLGAVAMTLNNLAGNYEGLARYADAAQMARSAYQLAGQQGQAAVRLTALLNMAEFHRSAGAYGLCWNTVQEALELVGPDTGAELHSALLARQGMLERRFGRLKVAAALLKRALVLAGQVDGPRAALIAEMQLALMQLPGAQAGAELADIAGRFRTLGYALLADLTELHAVYFGALAEPAQLLAVSARHRKHQHPHLAWLAALVAFRANGTGRSAVLRGLNHFRFAEAPEAWALLGDPERAAALRLEQAAGLPAKQRRAFLSQPI